MVAPREVLTDLGVRVRRQLADQVHGDLPRHHELLPSPLATDVVRVDGEVRGGLAQDVGHGEVEVARREHVRERLGNGLTVQRHLVHRRVDDRAHQRPFELADVRRDVPGDVVDDLGGNLHAAVLGVHLEDGDAGLEFGSLDVGDQTPFEAAPQAVLERRDVLRGPVGGNDQLLAGLVQRVEGMEELLLRALLACDELDVVDEKQVDAAIAVAEQRHLVLADGVDQFVRERFGGDVLDGQVRETLDHGVGNGVHQVGLAKPGLTVEEERVVGLPRRLRHGQSGGVGKVVVRPHHEVREDVLRIEHGPGARRRAGGRRSAEHVLLFVGLETDHLEGHAGRVCAEFLQGALDDVGVVRSQPVAREGVRHADVVSAVFDSQRLDLLEPGAKLHLRDLFPNAHEDIVPDSLILARHGAAVLSSFVPRQPWPALGRHQRAATRGASTRPVRSRSLRHAPSDTGPRPVR